MPARRVIVVATDGSDLAGPTVARAARLAVREDADLVIVCAYAEPSGRTDERTAATLGGGSRYARVFGRDAADVALAAGEAVAREEGATVAAALAVDGDPATAVLRVAAEREARLIVVGAPPERSMADLLAGTVATEVSRGATCDVLVVRPSA
jgi:nucleotide-binding universal stress UspA family protein